ncbi:MAG TPA: pitrilysin family protein [Longimicrobiales bacterium]|nr:pitrilysin family protein [Longimicrobiales bacterium]
MIEIPFRRHRLDNGLRIILSPERGAPVVAVNIWYGVGSRDERPGRTGFAHLFEHMMFQGSEHVPESMHFALIEQAGGSLNGSTWLDRTNYFETVPSHHLERALWLEADRMGWLLPAMTQEKLDNQRDVVKNERRWRVDNQPYGDWDERLQTMVYPEDHPYHHSVIGSMADLDAATLEDVEQFFRTYYAPNNAVLTVCGDFEDERALALIDKHFGGIPPGPDVPAIPGRTDIPTVLERHTAATVSQDISLPRLYLAYRTPSYGSEDFYTAMVASYILGWGKASVLYRQLVREQRVAQDVVAFQFPIVVGAAMLVVWATAMPAQDPQKLEDAMRSAMRGMRDITEHDVQRAIHLIEARQLADLQRVDERADMLSMFTMLFDQPERINAELDRIRAVSLGDMRAFVERHLDDEVAASLLYVPAAAEEAA